MSSSRRPGVLGITAIALALSGCARPTVSPAAAPPAAPAATFVMGARRGADLVVLSYATTGGALRSFGPALPLTTPPPGYQAPRFLYVFGERPDRVLAVVDTHQGYRSFVGDGARWTELSPQTGAGLRPFVSDGGALISLTVSVDRDGEPMAMERVMTLDGQVVDEWPYRDRAMVGFVDHGERWVSRSQSDGTRLLHQAGAAPRALAGEPVFDTYVGGATGDRYQVKDVTATEVRTGQVVARFEPAPFARATGSTSFRLGNTASVAGAALMKTVYSAGRCGDMECPIAAALDLWTFGDGTATERLLLYERASDPATGQAALAASGAHAIWFVDHHTLGVYDVHTRTRRTVTTDDELVLIQSPRR